MMKSLFNRPLGRLPRAALFLSGSGSNAVHLLKSLKDRDFKVWELAAIVTDRPLTSAARRIAADFGFYERLVELDIAAFYRAGGESRVTLATELGRKLRAEWTDKLREKLAPFNPDFGVLAGFVPLCNIAADFPCLNVHPGDLTYERDGRRVLAGLHTIPIENAIEEGLTTLRSSVIVAQPYSGSGSDDMDSGPVLGVSVPMEIDFMGFSVKDLLAAKAARPALRPKNGYGDRLEKVAKHNQLRLKDNGDFVVFPPVVRAFAQGLYSLDASGGLLWSEEGKSPVSVKTVEFGGVAPRPVTV